MDRAFQKHLIVRALLALGLVAVAAATVYSVGRFVGWAYSIGEMPAWMAWKIGAIAVGGLVVIFTFSALAALGLVRHLVPALRGYGRVPPQRKEVP